jgi:hypothetical protein
LLQNEGDYVITPPGVYHWGLNLCGNVNEAWNLTTPKWSRPTTSRSYCICGEVQFPVRLTADFEVDGVFMAKLVTGKNLLKIQYFYSYGFVFI